MPGHIIMDPSGHSTFEFDRTSKLELAEAELGLISLSGEVTRLPSSEVEAPTTFQTKPHACSTRTPRKQFLFLHFWVDDTLGTLYRLRYLAWMHRAGAERI